LSTYYLTCAIDYPNGEPHLGHAFEKIGADCIARFKRLQGNEVFFTTGVDENSLNVARTAREVGSDPQTFVDEISPKFHTLWQELNISSSAFVRTTDPQHILAAQEFFRRAYENGDIYESRYEGWYCLACESYYPDGDLVDQKCPVHETKPEWFSEENYFFALSRYQERLLEHFDRNPDFVRPEFRKNEVVNFLKGGLKDFSVSREGADWGIPVPLDESQVIYVWFDALVAYTTAVGFPVRSDLFTRWWPADAHVIGKDILRFHAIYWPAMLMAAGVDLPKSIVGHGWIDLDGKPMSKTTGTVVDPADVIKKYGVDPLRYYLLREVSFFRDGSFVWDNLDQRYHRELGNDLGNLLNRTVSMIGRYRNSVLPMAGPDTDAEKALKDAAKKAWQNVESKLEAWNFSDALTELWRLVAAANRYVDLTEPFKLARDIEQAERVDTILYNLAEALRSIALMLSPTAPETADKIMTQIGHSPVTDGSWVSEKAWGQLSAGTAVPGGNPLFPRLELE
jgi:methionyl-tRNA synthetase